VRTASAPDQARLVLDAPERGNRVTTEDLRAIDAFLDQVASDAPALLRIEATGEDFCLGRDASGDGDAGQATESLRLVVQIGRKLRDLPALVVCAVQGRARGFGAGVLVHSDLAVAARGADLAFDEVERGFPPTIVMGYLEDHFPRKVARELICTGRTLGIEEAQRHGIVNRVVDEVELAAETDRLCAELLAQPRAALTVCKPFLVEMRDADQAERDRRAVTDLVAFLAENRER
jgi:enoyl-CoA hydratase/carnithine racemase